MSDKYFKCDRCGKKIPVAYMCFDEDTHEELCTECFRSNEENYYTDEDFA